ncbi:hypothetical protein ILUMI_22731 [Ignelater luminosus]|uniref:Reverse transcriptase domain-containing protein n=1 Tax=Ignelater luminosus TaxID=2038154 RepID=A0A8K0CDA6_IGNLU|nr:hypothetical protein ILUMI_22731 [Ignelater luminosus]
MDIIKRHKGQKRDTTHSEETAFLKISRVMTFLNTKINRLGPRGAFSLYYDTQFFGQRLTELKGIVSTLRHVSKGARSSVAEALAQTLEAIVKRVSVWKSNRSAAAPHARNPKPTYTRTSNKTQLTKKVEAKLVDNGDIHGALRLLTSEDTTAPHNKETILALAKKHPPHPTPTTFSSPPTEPIKVPEAEEKELKAIIATFRSCSSKKKAGGFRQIAVGITFRRMTAKVVFQRIKKPITNELIPHQLRVGIPRKAEIDAHSAWTYINAKHKSPKVVLKLSFQNAFNEVRRDIMLSAVSIPIN